MLDWALATAGARVGGAGRTGSGRACVLGVLGARSRRRALGVRTSRRARQGAAGVGARGAGRGRADSAAWALGARPGRLGWPRLCTRCTRLDFQTGFQLGIFLESLNEDCSL